MPLIGAKSILLCSDDGNNVRTAQRWAKEHGVSADPPPSRAFACRVCVILGVKVQLLVDTKETRGALLICTRAPRLLSVT